MEEADLVIFNTCSIREKPELKVHSFLGEARSPLILGFTSAIISLIAYSTVVGVIAGGGIGYLALQEGFYMWNQPLMWVIILLMVLAVQIIQLLGSALARMVDKKGKSRKS